MSASVTVVNEKHVQRSLQKLAEYRRSEKFCDIKLCINGQNISAHTIVLAASSCFFEAMFNGSFLEGDASNIELRHDTTFEIMLAIIEYLYSGHLTFPECDAVMLIKNMDYLKIECDTILQKMLNDENCIALYALTDEIDRVDLKDIATGYILQHWKQIVTNDKFQELNQDQLEYLLKRSDRSKADVLYETVIKWLKHDEPCRGQYAEQLLRQVSVDDLSAGQINDHILKEEFLKRNSGGCRWLLTAIVDNRTRISVNVSAKPATFYIMSLQRKTYAYKFHALDKSLIEAQSPPEFSYCSMTRYKNMIYAVGGVRQGTIVNVALRYDTKEDSWSESEFRVGKCSCGICTNNDQMFLIGGEINASFQSTCSSYDYKTGLFNALPNMVRRKWRPGVCAYNSSIYVLGGKARSERSAIIERYDPREGQWFKAGVLDYDLYCSAAVISNSIYCLKVGTKNLVRYDPRTLHHAPINSLSHKGYDIVAVDNQLYLVDEEGIKAYSSKEDSWTPMLEKEFTEYPTLIARNSFVVKCTSFV